MKNARFDHRPFRRWALVAFMAMSAAALAACGHGGRANSESSAATGSGAGSAGTGASAGAGASGSGGTGGTAGCANPVMLYTDEDGDGYSLERPGSPVPTCLTGSIPPGHTTTTKGWDCDDTDPTLTTHCPSRLVKDINPIPGANPSSNPRAFTSGLFGAFFAATDSRNGTELWYTDTTPGGTKLVIDLAPGPTSSNPQLITPAIDFTYFVATTPDFGTELWQTDGTAVNTKLVADLVPGPGSSTITAAVAVNDRLYFIAKTLGASFELWQTDGDPTSTQKVDLAGFVNPSQLTPLGSSVFFFAEGASGRALFRIDTSGPTKVYPTGWGTSQLSLLTQIGPAVYYVDNGLDVRRATTTSDALFTSMQGMVNGLAGNNQCIQPSGTIEHLASAATSKVVFDVHAYLGHGGLGCPALASTGQDYWYVAAPGSSPALLPGYGGVNGNYQYEQRTTHLATSGPDVFLVVWDCPWASGVCGNSGPAEKQGQKTLWRFDGTNAHQVLQMGYGAFFDALTPTGSSVYWLGPASVDSNGVPQGNQGDALWLNGYPTAVSAATGYSGILPFAPVSTGAYLSAKMGGQSGLYFLDAGSPTPALVGPSVAVDTANAGVASLLELPAGFKDYLVFPGDDGMVGSEPWVSDGTATGTMLLKDIATDPGSSYPEGFTELGGNVLFSADDGSTGAELWKSDGTGAGTIQVKDIWAGKNSSSPAAFSVINGTVYFSANDGYTGTQFWSTLGTDADTQLVADIYGGLMQTPNGPVPNSSNPGPFVSFAGSVFFPATQGPSSKVELFRYTGSGAPGPAILFKNINPSSTNGSNPRALTVAGGKLFFIADDGTNGEQLWATDGTDAGTISLKQPSQPANALKNSELVAVGSQVFFAAVDSVKGRELWASDGTLAGTMLTDEINPAGDSNPDGFAVSGTTIYFAATDQNGDRELWSKVAAAPAQRVADINPTGSSNPDTLVVAGSVLFFAADDGVHGRELCTSQGSSASTTCFDIWPGAMGSGVSSIVAVDAGRAVLAASDGTRGVELWQSNGTAAGTVIVDDIAPGTSSSNPTAMVWSPALFRVFFQADDSKGGVELRTISLPSLGP